ncbi:unnamed protein product, partial [Arabidopsis halleri]
QFGKVRFQSHVLTFKPFYDENTPKELNQTAQLLCGLVSFDFGLVSFGFE